MQISLAKGALFGLGGTGVLGAGGYLAWRSQQPTDVKSRLIWEGLSVADSKTLGVYKALYLANSKKEGFSSFVTADDKEKAAPLWKDKCDGLLDVNVSSDKYEKSLEEARKWCLVPEKTTIEISLLLEDFDFASTDDDYKNAFALNRSSQPFIDAIKNGQSDLATTSAVNTGFSKVREWCNSIKEKPFSESDLKNTRAWCNKPDSNLDAFMNKLGFKPVSSDGWSSKFTSLNSPSTDNSLSQDINLGGSDGGTQLKVWCAGKDLKNAQIHSLLNDLEKIKSRCFVKK